METVPTHTYPGIARSKVKRKRGMSSPTSISSFRLVRVHVFNGEDLSLLLRRVRTGVREGNGPVDRSARLVIVPVEKCSGEAMIDRDLAPLDARMVSVLTAE